MTQFYGLTTRDVETDQVHIAVIEVNFSERSVCGRTTKDSGSILAKPLEFMGEWSKIDQYQILPEVGKVLLSNWDLVVLPLISSGGSSNFLHLFGKLGIKHEDLDRRLLKPTKDCPY